MLSATALLRAGFAAARKESRLVVPLGLGEACAALAGLLPAVWLALRAVLLAMHVSAPDPQAALALGALAAIFDPQTWTFYLGLALFAAAAAWLLRTALYAGTLKCLAVPLSDEKAPAAAFGEMVLDDPARWFAARALAVVLQGVAFFSATGTLVLGIACFTAHPGPFAALLMTVATGVFICLPLVDAALGLGFSRAALLPEGPAEALGEGLRLAWARRSALIPAWFVFALADVAIAVSAGAASATIGSMPPGEARWVLLLAPRALVLVFAAVARALVSLARLGVYAALVLEDAKRLQEPAVPAPPEPVYQAVAVEEPVFEAVPVAEATKPPEDDGSSTPS